MESTSRYEASEAIRKLIRLQPETAKVLRSDTVQTVGIEELKPEDVTAKFENGILQLSVPKAEQKRLPKTTTIAIE